ncbi:MAG: antibiotic biosynthesis monooxygenase [Planctomycetaceae bacterium]|nr:antibiotic biosynthesis monooxygenase [Planctomycetaceae bacterium]
MICVIATVDVAAGRREELLAMFREVAPKVRAEPGCIEYVAMVDVRSGLNAQGPVRDNAVTIIEKWESVAALQTHLKTLHMADYFRKTDDLQLSLSLQVLEPV